MTRFNFCFGKITVDGWREVGLHVGNRSRKLLSKPEFQPDIMAV